MLSNFLKILVLLFVLGPSGIAATLDQVDIKIYIPSSSPIPISDLEKELKNAQHIFNIAGVQLNFSIVSRIQIAPISRNILGSFPEQAPSQQSSNFYKNFESEKHRMSDHAIQLFTSIIGQGGDNDRSIHIILMNQVKSSYYFSSAYEKPKLRTITTGAQSFPPYAFENRIPRNLRGVITLQRLPGRNLAHELGHKLINVSHEWRHIEPQIEVKAEGGLMLYGKGIEIPSGRDGRWHLERLHLSPFIYRLINGQKIWNPDFKHFGQYADPIYGDFKIE